MIIEYCNKSQKFGYLFKTNGYEQFQVIIVREGVLRYGISGYRGSVVDGGALVLPHESAFELSCPSEGYTGLGLFVRGESSTRWPASVSKGVARFLNLNSVSLALRDYLLGDLADPSPGHEVTGRQAAELLMRLIIDTVDDSEYGVGGAEYWAAKVARALEGNVRSGKTVAESLRGLGLSYRQASRYFKQVYRQSPKRYQLRCRLREAELMIRKTSMGLTDVAYELGFSSLQHFSMAFKKEYGVSPGRC